MVFGFFEKDIQKTKNSVIFADSGKIIHKYSKTHLYNAFSYDESKDIKEANNPLKAFDTRFGKMGLMVCYELCFPEITRTLALQGAKLIIVGGMGSLKKSIFHCLLVPELWKILYFYALVRKQKISTQTILR